MSRVAKRPVDLPAGVTATVAANLVKVKGAKGELSLSVADGVTVEVQDKKLQIGFANPESRMTAGATRAHISPTW
jgi:large subunit ribosomal protein L6